MGSIATRPVLRWLLPAGIAAAVIAGGTVASAVRASAGASLPDRSAAQLLVDLQTARLDGLSGTVVERADLGLPELPSVGGEGSSQFNSLISGSHTLRVWFSGPDKARVALLGTLGESDIIVNGSDLWIWSSGSNTAVHQRFPDRDAAGRAGAERSPLAEASPVPLTPQQAADRALAAIDPSTAVTTDGRAVVAGRPCYELVLRPRDTASKVGAIRIAVDGRKHVPLRVQAFPRNSAKPAAEIGFTQVDFNRPDASRFRFNPPPGVKVTEGVADAARKAGADPARDAAKRTAHREPVALGSGWTTVLAANVSDSGLLRGMVGGRATPGARGGDADKPGEAGATAQQTAGALLNALPRVSGSWGSGRLLSGRLFSVLVTDDGRVLAGAVNPDRLYAAAADPATAGLKG